MKLKYSLRNLFPMLTYARYNVAAWQRDADNHLFLLGRNVNAPARPDEPDVGSLVMTEFDQNGQMLSDTQVWKPSDNEFSLEDPRAMVEANGDLVVGMTAVYKKITNHIYYPAVVKLTQEWVGKLPEVLVIDAFGAGKNTTPLGGGNYIFRPETEEFNHKMLSFKIEDGQPRKTGEIIMPSDLYWAKWKIGTTVPPIWIDQDSAIFMVHGITRVDNIWHYSIGLGKLVRTDAGFEVKVEPDPILTPKDFNDENGTQLVGELRPEERKVVYACGGVVDNLDKDKLKVFVNAGDKATFEVTFSMREVLERIGKL